MQRWFLVTSSGTGSISINNVLTQIAPYNRRYTPLLDPLPGALALLCGMGDNPSDETLNHALKIQTEDLHTPQRIPSTRSLNDSFTSSPIITPSGSTLQLPSSALTPLPSPLVSAGGLPLNLSLDPLVLGTSPRRKGYGLGIGGVSHDKRNASEFVPTEGLNENLERSVSSSLSGRTVTDDGLRREEVIIPRSRQSSVGDEIFVYALIILTDWQDLEFWRTPDNQWLSSPGRYVRLKALGRGTFSKVVLCEPFDPSHDCRILQPDMLAIKVVKLDATIDASADRITSSARRELDILKKISHPCITRLLAYKELPDKCLFGLQFCPGGDLFDFASKNRSLLNPPLVKIIFRELCEAVYYLHETMHVVHRDLKLESPFPTIQLHADNRRFTKLFCHRPCTPRKLLHSSHIFNRSRSLPSLRPRLPSPHHSMRLNRLCSPRNYARPTL